MAENINNDEEPETDQEDSDQNQESPDEKGFLTKKKIIIIAAAALLVFIAVAVILFLFISGGSDTEEISADGEIPAEEEVAVKVEFIPFENIVKLDDVEIALTDMGVEMHLAVGISLTIEHPEMRDEIIRKKDEINAMILSMIHTKTIKELSDTEGKITLKNEMIHMLNGTLNSGRIVNLCFHKFFSI